MNVIEVKNLTKDYGSGRGVFDVNLAVKQGEVFGFLGPNGAGKSTTIRHLMGFSKPDKGETYIFGKPTFDKYYEILSKVGYIPGEIALPQGLTGWEFIRMMQNLQGVKNEEMQEVFVNFIHEEKARGKTILLSSHIFSEIDSTCDRIAIIKDGRIVSEFVADDLKHASLKYYSVKFASDADEKKFETESKKLSSLNLIAKEEDGGIKMSLEDKDLNAFIALLSDCNASEFSNRRETLEDYFMKFYKEDKDFGGALK